VELGTRPVAARRAGDTRVLSVERGGRRAEVAADAILVAAGRAPNVEGLGLDAAGVRHGPDGIAVDDRLRTSNARVYAIGDCTSPQAIGDSTSPQAIGDSTSSQAIGDGAPRWRFTHTADAQARLAVPNALFFGLGGGRASGLVVPWCTYTSPEVAHVGMTADDAARAGAERVTVPLADVDRAVLDGDGEGDGFLRVHLARGGGRILGATLVAEHAGETISELTAAIVHRIPLSGLGRAIHPYPTVAEAIRKAADAHRRTRLTPRARALFGAFFRAVR
jgi:pyruvate/2-oxoglutarate dehydrogenase complex dihydrolipoamide dehydrogenase (E3) component